MVAYADILVGLQMGGGSITPHGDELPQRLHDRLQQLKHELDVGQVQFDQLELQRTSLRDTLLRISGAIRVLEELLGERPSELPSADPEEQTTRSG